MLKSLGTSLRIGIARKGITLLRIQGWRQPRLSVLADLPLQESHTDDHPELLQQLRTALDQAQCIGFKTSIVMADDWVRYFMATPARNAMRLDDCKAAADMRFHTLFGESTAAWRLEADWDAHRPFPVCAAPRWLLDGIERIAAERKLIVINVAPHFIAAWNQWGVDMGYDAWFGVAHRAHLTLGIVQHGRLSAMRTAVIPEGADADPIWLNGHVMREALRLGLAAPAQVQVCGDAAARWCEDGQASPVCRRADEPLHKLITPSGSSGMHLAMAGLRL